MKSILTRFRHLSTRPIFYFWVTGIASTIWFLVRVIPKPSRATYPCMRAAAPVMSSFVVYLIGLWGSAFAIQQLKSSLGKRHYFAGVGFLALLAVALAFTAGSDMKPSSAASFLRLDPPDGPNQPMGIAQGVIPGRVTWAHDRAATDSLCSNGAGDRYFRVDNYNQEIIDSMVAKSLMKLTGAETCGEAWDSIFTYHNSRAHGDRRGYTAGEKIFIKINQGTASWLYVSGTAYEAPDIVSGGSAWKADYAGACEASPPVSLAILRQLVNVYGVDQQDIYIGDPISHIYKHNYDIWHNEFPDVHYIDKSSSFGRAELHLGDTAAIGYSDLGTHMPEAETDKLYKEMTDASYMINIFNLKPHLRAGITLGAKNHFGSHTRDAASHLHPSLISPEANNDPQNAGYGKYRVFVDIMGSMHLGGKTMLFITDALWGGGPEETKAPRKWKMAPFNNDWTSSVFMSLDQVALESVCFDFIRTEYNGINQPETHPNWDGVDDYLHQAADSVNWPEGILYDPEQDGSLLASLGVHEHWENSTTKAYSRNLQTGNGIELVQIPPVIISAPTAIETFAQHDLAAECYPNPFRGETQIRYSLSERARVTVQIRDLTGRSVARLISRIEEPGTHQVTWNAAGVSSGSYLAEIETNVKGKLLVRRVKIQLVQ